MFYTVKTVQCLDILVSDKQLFGQRSRNPGQQRFPDIGIDLGSGVRFSVFIFIIICKQAFTSILYPFHKKICSVSLMGPPEVYNNHLFNKIY